MLGEKRVHYGDMLSVSRELIKMRVGKVYCRRGYLLNHRMAGTVTASKNVEMRSMEADSASAAL